MPSGYLIVGDTRLARRVCASFDPGTIVVDHLREPTDADLRTALAHRPAAVAVLVHDDVTALRYALAIAHLAPETRLLVTVFDRTVGDQLTVLLPHVIVTSLADLAAPLLAGPCMDPAWLAARSVGRRIEVTTSDGDGVHRTEVEAPRRRALRLPRLRAYDTGTRLMLAGLCGIGTILLLDWLWLVVGLGRRPAPAFLDAARVVATVGPAPQDSTNTWYAVFAATAMLVTIVLAALFTAGIVERLLGDRMLAVFGPRSAPRSGHVIVVGLGQVGIRLCVELRKMGVPVIGVERDTAAPNLRIARSLRIAAVVGHGADRRLLDDLGLSRCRALAAVGSDDMDNIAIAVAAHGVSPGTRVVLRAGEQEATAETRALLPLGIIRDINSSSAAYVVALLSGDDVEGRAR